MPTVRRKRWNIDVVRQYFTKKRYSLLSSKYISHSSKLIYMCPERHINSMTLSNFRMGSRCPDCYGRKKLTIEQVRQAFAQQGYALLSQHYINAHTSLDYVCPEGHTNTITWANFRLGNRCSMCTSSKRKKKLEDITKAFSRNGYKLLTQKYVDCKTKLKYICPEGHKGQIRWNDFQQGHRCFQCREWKGEKELGEILEQLYPGKVEPQDSLEFLGRQTVDYSVRQYHLAFEYDGEHHFRPVVYNNGDAERSKERFAAQQRRDTRKDRLCKKNNYILVRIAYNEALNLDNVKRKITELGGS